MKWKKVSEHPLPDGDGDKIYIAKFIDGSYHSTRCLKQFLETDDIYKFIEWCEFNPDEIESAEVQAYDVSEQFKNLNAPYLLRDLHDEIENSDDESNVTTDSNEIGDYNLDKIFHSALRSSVKIVEPKEPSWEEKFRWETAVKMFIYYKDNFHSNAAIEESLKTTNMIIDELKRGRE